jgi:hypothetical protein
MLIVIVAAILSFELGIWLEDMRNEAYLIRGAVEAQGIQMAVDSLQAQYPEDFDRLGGISDTTEVRKAIASALFGNNDKLNPMKIIFLVVRTDAVENGQLRDPFGRKIDFRLVEESLGTNDLKKRILVMTEQVR